MGITIYYSGKLFSMEQLPTLIEEVTEICQRVGWEYQIIYRSFEIPVQGIAFAPKGSQYVWMTFLDDGTLISPDSYLTAQELELDIEDECRVETKTHYAGPKAHMMLITLVKYIGAKYFSAIGMYDESHFWETRNEAICRREFEVMEQWVAQMICKLDKLDGRIGDVGDSGELVDERIWALMDEMPMFDVLTLLETPRPSTDEFSTMDN
jgi:hypothetical protein